MILSFKHIEFITKTKREILEEISNNVDLYYKPFLKSGRNLNQVLYPLSKIQKSIEIYIKKNISFESCVKGYIKKNSNITHLKEHKGKKYHFKTDIKQFFPSIKSKIVYKTFIKNGFSHDISHLLTKLITYKNQLPQGSVTSPLISNLVCIEMDKELQILCKKYNIKYTRYVDDMMFSSKIDFQDKIQDIINIILKYNFKVKSTKTAYKVGNISSAGGIISNNGLKPFDKHIEKAKTNINVQNYINNLLNA